MKSDLKPDEARHFPTPEWEAVGASGNLDAPDVDCETAALFRAALIPLFTQSASWPALMEILAGKGYGLAIREGRLYLTNYATGARVCSTRFLGLPLRDLVVWMGRPIVRALPGQRADGEIRHAPTGSVGV